ncbi:MAG: zinc ribbon domain-containing protein [Lachnospiraceae bacterium]|jgi:hypothetical protein|nr:zinc ribbon domain-containing protein [Lachnospiraceae bacterium]
MDNLGGNNEGQNQENMDWTKQNPLGENPLGEGFVGDSSFGKFGGLENAEMEAGDGNGNEKVCPTCGATIAEGESYCMACGMSVIPVLRRDYEKAIEHGIRQSGNASGNPYGDTFSQGNAQDRLRQGASGEDRYGARRQMSYSNRNKSASGFYSFVGILSIVALIFAVFFLVKGIGSSKEEKITVMSRHVVSPIADRIETYTLYATGDMVTRLTFETSIDISGRDQRAIDATITKTRQQYEEQEAQTFIDFDIRQEGDRLIMVADYKNLNLTSNVEYLLEAGVLQVDGDNAKKKSDYVSYRAMVEKLQSQKYTKQQ